MRWRYQIIALLCASVTIHAGEHTIIVPQRIKIPENLKSKPLLEDNVLPEPEEPNQIVPHQIVSPEPEIVSSPGPVPLPKIELVSRTIAAGPTAVVSPVDASFLLKHRSRNPGRNEPPEMWSSGTCVESIGGVSTIVTCWHQLKFLANPLTFVEVEKKEIAARLIAFDKDSDIAIYEVAADLPAIEIDEETPSVKMACSTIGLDSKAEGVLERRVSEVAGVDKYDRMQNIEILGQEASGRSGGGCFAGGKLIGTIQGTRRDVNVSICCRTEPILQLLSRRGAAVVGAKPIRAQLVIEYWSSGCPHGDRLVRDINRILKPKNWSIGESENDQIRFVAVDKTVVCPTIALLQNGVEINRWEGYQDPGMLSNELLNAWNLAPATTEIPVSSARAETGASISGRAVVENVLSTLTSTLGNGSKIDLFWHRSGGKDAILIGDIPLKTDVLGTSGRIEIVVTSEKNLPIREIKFGYRIEGNRYFLKFDEIEITIPDEGTVGDPQPVGSPILIAYTVLSVIYDIHQLLHPTVDIWLGETVTGSAVLSGDSLAVSVSDSHPILVRVHWSFMFGWVKFEYNRPLTGVLLRAESAAVQFHKSRIYRDVSVPIN